MSMEGVTEKLANAFSGVIRTWATEDRREGLLEHIDKMNKRYAALPESDYRRGCCATGDIWDSNMAMLEAWEKVFDGGEPDAENQADADLWNAACDMAKEAGFSEPENCC